MNIPDSIGSFFNRTRTGVSQDPVRDWLILITLSTIALAGIIVWNVWAFGTVANGGVIGNTVPAATPVFNQTSLDTIRTIFTNRTAEQVKYTTGVYRYSDPSL